MKVRRAGALIALIEDDSGDQGVQQPDRAQPGVCLRGEARRHGRTAAGGRQHERAPVDRVGDRPAEQPDRHGGDHLRHPDGADRQR